MPAAAIRPLFYVFLPFSPLCFVSVPLPRQLSPTTVTVMIVPVATSGDSSGIVFFSVAAAIVCFCFVFMIVLASRKRAAENNSVVTVVAPQVAPNAFASTPGAQQQFGYYNGMAMQPNSVGFQPSYVQVQTQQAQLAGWQPVGYINPAGVVVTTVPEPAMVVYPPPSAPPQDETTIDNENARTDNAPTNNAPTQTGFSNF